MRVHWWVWMLGWVAFAGHEARAVEPTLDFQISFNGQRAFSDERDLREGDVINFYGTSIRLGGPGKYDLVTESSDRIYRKSPDGKRVLVGCRVHTDDEPPKPGAARKLVNPLAMLSREELRQLRGVKLEAWSPGIESMLAQLDHSRSVIEVEPEGFGPPENLPELPVETTALVVRERNQGFKGWEQLARLKQLQHLDLSRRSKSDFDFTVLRGLPLRFLALPPLNGAQNVEVVGTITSLEVLTARGAGYLRDAAWLSALKNLRSLELIRIGSKETPLDLGSIARLPALKQLNVQSSFLRALPSAPLPALRRADLLLASIPKESFDAFRAANPQCEITHGLNESLQKMLARVDRLLVRTGGVCHRRKETEKILLDTREATDIAQISRSFVVAEDGSSFHCMCCGNPTFEFYRGGEIVAMVAFHHGKSIRWTDGPWPTDGMLALPSAKYLVDWLSARGAKGPKLELQETEQAEEAGRRMMARYEAALPSGLLAALGNAESAESAAQAWKAQIPDARDRTSSVLKAYGCDGRRWNNAAGLDSLIERSWGELVDPVVFKSLMRDAQLSAAELAGGARRVFGDRKWDDWKDEPKVLARLARQALLQPQAFNRRATLAGLRDFGGPEAIAVLRECLQGDFKPAPLAPEDAAEPVGMVTFRGDSVSLPEAMTDAAVAALHLTLLEDQESAPAVTRLRARLPTDQAAAFSKALKTKSQRAAADN